LKAFTYNPTTAKFNTPFAAASSVKTPFGNDPCGALSVSSNQSVAGTGIVWATKPLADPDHTTVQGKLYAFDATNVSKKLWDSRQNASRDDFGNFAKFVAPTVANGKVYVATDSYQVCAYGLNPPPPTPKFTVGEHVVTTTSGVHVRSTPGGTIIGQQGSGASGTIVSGPVVGSDGITYWQVNFTTPPSGWVREVYLKP
jgi:hypothetical protein